MGRSRPDNYRLALNHFVGHPRSHEYHLFSIQLEAMKLSDLGEIAENPIGIYGSAQSGLGSFM